MRALFAMMTVLGLAGCAADAPRQAVAPTVAPTVGAPVPPPPSVSLGALRGGAVPPSPSPQGESTRGGRGLSGRPVAVAALLGTDEEPRGDDGVFALVLAERGPRAEALCQATLERLDLVDLQAAERPRYARRPVFWMVSRSGAALDTQQDISCTEISAGVDVQRAQSLGQSGDVGPVLLGVANRGGSQQTMRWDLSAIPVSEFPRAMRIWTDLLLDDPARWDDRASRVRWRESARAFLIRYGEPLESLAGRPARAEVARTPVRFTIVR